MLTAIIPRNAAAAADRRIPFLLFDATDLITPENITVTGVKVSLSFGGGAVANSTNDIVKVDGASGRYYVELTQAESNVSPCSVVGYLKPAGCAACYPSAQIAASTVYTATASAAEIAGACRDDAIQMLRDGATFGATSLSLKDSTGASVGVAVTRVARDAIATTATP